MELGIAKAIIVSTIYWYVNVHFSISKLGNSALLLILYYICYNMLKFVYTNKRVIILMYPFHCFSKYKKLSFCKQFFTCNLPIWLLNTSHISIKSNIASFDWFSLGIFLIQYMLFPICYFHYSTASQTIEHSYFYFLKACWLNIIFFNKACNYYL